MNTYVQSLASSYERQATGVAQRLRSLAETIERDSQPRPNISHGTDKSPDYVYAAGQIVHAVTWGIANLNLPGLIDTASEIHYARTLETDA